MALSVARNRQKPGHPRNADQGGGGTARNARTPAPGTEASGLRPPLIPSCRRGRSTCWANADGGLLPLASGQASQLWPERLR
eukprot:15448176-Alexandrium_andersonii.AAC.1